MAKERKTLKTSKVKKKWYQILASKEFNEVLIGETPSFDPRLLIDKVITVNLMSLTRDMKKQNVIMRFKVVGLKENKAITEPIGYQIVPSFIKRIIRRGRNNLHDSFVCKTSDEKNVRLKPLMITVNKTKGVVINSLMNALRANLTEYVRKITYKELVNQLVSHKLQSNLRIPLKKIYPLRSCEIKEMILETEKKVIGKKEVKEEINKAEIEEKPKEEVEVKEESDKADKKEVEIENKEEEKPADVKKEEAKPEEKKSKEKEANQDNSNKKEIKEKKESKKTKK